MKTHLLLLGSVLLVQLVQEKRSIPDSVSSPEKAAFAEKASRIAKFLTGQAVSPKTWIVDGYRGNSMVGVKHPIASFGFERTGKLRSYWSGKFADRMRSGTSRENLKITEARWFQKGETIAKYLWPDVDFVRKSVSHRGVEVNRLSGGWQLWSNVTQVKLWTKARDGVYSEVSIGFDRSLGQCLVVNRSKPVPVKRQSKRR